MTINYTTNLGLAEPVTGTESGNWGDDVNKGLTDYLDAAIAGAQTISGTQTAVTLSITNGSSTANNLAQAGSGATGSAQYQIINCTGTPASLLTITAPASSKTYIVINSTAQSVKIVGAGPTTGVTIQSGLKAVVAWNGSDFVFAALPISTNLNFNGTSLSSPAYIATGTITGSSTAGVYSYGTLGYSDVNHILTMASSQNSYIQMEVQNTNAGSAASADVVVGNNNTTATTYYGDFGMNSSGWTGTAGTNSFGSPNTVYLTATTGDLLLGTTTANVIRLATNGGADAVTIGTSNQIAFNGSYGTTGQALLSNGSGAAPSWGTAGISTGKAIAMAIVFS